MAADLAVFGARIRTMNPAQPFVEALAVKDGRIVALGSAAEVRAECDSSTVIQSGADWHITPGLNDGHQHLLMGSQVGRGINFDRVSNLDDVRALLRAERTRVGPGGWVQGFAFEYAALGGLEYHHDLINEAAGDGPMLFHALDMHTAFANGEALRIAGVTGARRFADASIVVCDSNGAPTGELREQSAIYAVTDHAPIPTDEEKLGWYAETIRAQNAVGITSIHQMDGGQETIDALRALEAAGELTLRVRLHQWVDAKTDPAGILEMIARRDEAGIMWTANSVKFMLDGVIDTGTAWLEEPDTHGNGTDPMWPDMDHFRRTLRQFHDAGFYIATHAIGDRSVREVLDAYETFPGESRHRIEHVEAAPPASVQRFARQKVSASMQPIHLRWLNADMTDPWSERLGVHRCDHTMPSGDIYAAGANVVLGSDWPVAPYDPRLGIFAAQRRYAPDVDDHRSLGQSRGLTGLETLAGYTVNAARVTGESGALEVGGRADFVAWGADPADCVPEDVVELPVHLTVVDGRIAHQTV